MIYQLEKSQYKKVFPLLEGGKNIIDIKAVLETNNHGFVFADSHNTPKTALVWTKNGAFLVGDTKNDNFNNYFDEFINIIISPILKALNYDDFEVCGAIDEWNNIIESIFKKRKLNINMQSEYKFFGFQKGSLPDVNCNHEYKLCRVTKELLNGGFKNIDFLTDGILIFWNTMEEFFQKGFGWCITCGDMIISRCTCDYIYKNQRTLGIETYKDYRRKGFARTVAIECLKHCHNHNYEVHWDCTNTNYASAALAKSLGFKEEFEYKVYWFLM